MSLMDVHKYCSSLHPWWALFGSLFLFCLKGRRLRSVLSVSLLLIWIGSTSVQIVQDFCRITADSWALFLTLSTSTFLSYFCTYLLWKSKMLPDLVGWRAYLPLSNKSSAVRVMIALLLILNIQAVCLNWPRKKKKNARIAVLHGGWTKTLYFFVRSNHLGLCNTSIY